MFDQSDPRASLAPAVSRPAATGFADSQYYHFNREPPAEDQPGSRSWYGRAANFVVAYSQAEAGGVLARRDQAAEYALVLPDADGAIVTTPAERRAIPGRSVTFIPPGDSSIEMPRGGRLVRVFAAPAAPDLAAKAGRPAAATDPNIPPFEPWPAPPGGFRLRSYDLEAPPMPGAFGRIWRCSSLMVLYVAATIGPRDASKLSPHAHDDFQQCCLILDGSFEFNIRWPWLTDQSTWRADQHEVLEAPAMAVIPAQALHTTRRLDPGVNYVIDFYAPPRADFSAAGWVLNAADYPAP